MALTGVLCVIPTGKGKMSCYLFGLVNTVLYAWIAFGARYYGEVMLNACYYVPMQFVGWFVGKKHMDGKTKEVEKARLTVSETDTTSGFVRCLHLRLRAGIETIGRKPPLYRQHEHLPVRAGHASQCQAPYGAVDSMDCGGCGDCIHVVCQDYQKGGTDIATLLMWCIYLLNAMFMFVKWFRESGEHVNEV